MSGQGLLARAVELGFSRDEVAGLAALSEDGDDAAMAAELARMVEAKLAATQEEIVRLIERGAELQADPEVPAEEVARLQGQIVELAGTVGPLHATGAALTSAAATPDGGCGEGCGCARTAGAPRVPASRAALALETAGGSGSDIVCTLDGGVGVMRERITQWQDVLAAATGREAADGGVTLVYEHDQALTVELARLAAAEFACCSFFTFSLTVGPPGMRFTVTAPEEAHDVVTAVFGVATAAPGGDAPIVAGER